MSERKVAQRVAPPANRTRIVAAAGRQQRQTKTSPNRPVDLPSVAENNDEEGNTNSTTTTTLRLSTDGVLRCSDGQVVQLIGVNSDGQPEVLDHNALTAGEIIAGQMPNGMLVNITTDQQQQQFMTVSIGDGNDDHDDHYSDEFVLQQAHQPQYVAVEATSNSAKTLPPPLTPFLKPIATRSTAQTSTVGRKLMTLANSNAQKRTSISTTTTIKNDPAQKTSATTSNSSATFNCELCTAAFGTQLDFFHHLQSHYAADAQQAAAEFETQPADVLEDDNDDDDMIESMPEPEKKPIIKKFKTYGRTSQVQQSIQKPTSIENATEEENHTNRGSTTNLFIEKAEVEDDGDEMPPLTMLQQHHASTTVQGDCHDVAGAKLVHVDGGQYYVVQLADDGAGGVSVIGDSESGLMGGELEDDVDAEMYVLEEDGDEQMGEEDHVDEEGDEDDGQAEWFDDDADDGGTTDEALPNTITDANEDQPEEAVEPSSPQPTPTSPAKKTSKRKRINKATLASQMDCFEEIITQCADNALRATKAIKTKASDTADATASTDSGTAVVKKKRARAPSKKATAAGSTKTYKCRLCDKVCKTKNSLHYHFLLHTGERPHKCHECGKGFFANSALKVHMRLHTGDKPYVCEVCSRAFRQWGDLRYHMSSLHSEEKNHQCEFCGKDFARRYSLVIHRRIHTGERNYTCEFCNKSFRASTYLQDHRRIHTGEKPHECEYCGKKFRVRGDLKRHWNIHLRKKAVGGDWSALKDDDGEKVEEEEDGVDAGDADALGLENEEFQYENDDDGDAVADGVEIHLDDYVLGYENEETNAALKGIRQADQSKRPKTVKHQKAPKVKSPR